MSAAPQIRAAPVQTPQRSVRARLIVIGAGEGGAESLLRFLRGGAPVAQPIVIVQRNLPEGFAAHLARLAGQTTGRPCGEAVQGEVLRDGMIRIAPAGQHVGIVKTHLGLTTILMAGDKLNGSRPAVDPLFTCAATACGAEVIGIILSGRGRDGCDGAARIAAAGGTVLAEDPAAALHGAMARHAAAAGHIAGIAQAAGIGALIEKFQDGGAPAGRQPTPRTPSGAVQAVVIGASTGGPAALSGFLEALPRGFALPILVVQHMPPGFPRRLAATLADTTGWPVAEAADGAKVQPREILIAPGDRHMRVVRAADGVRVALDDAAPVDFNRPSVDLLFESAAAIYGAGAAGVVLSGTGQDGLKGCRAIASRQGLVLAQDQASSAAWGMPGAVAGAGLGAALKTPELLALLIADAAAAAPRAQADPAG